MLAPAVNTVWSLWKRTQGHSYTLWLVGAMGAAIPVGKNMPAVESQARAMGISWNELTTKWYEMIVDAWLADQAHKRA